MGKSKRLAPIFFSSLSMEEKCLIGQLNFNSSCENISLNSMGNLKVLSDVGQIGCSVGMTLGFDTYFDKSRHSIKEPLVEGLVLGSLDPLSDNQCSGCEELGGNGASKLHSGDYVRRLILHLN